jgi:glycosyltransferase involved in cell wall biosynthesis
VGVAYAPLSLSRRADDNSRSLANTAGGISWASSSQRMPLPDVNWLGTIYHGLPPASLRARTEPGDYLAFLGRLSPEKGPEVAIELARSIRMPLRIAAKVPRAERNYFKERLEPLIDGEQIQIVTHGTPSRLHRGRCNQSM